jgi:hypothetical protein
MHEVWCLSVEFPGVAIVRRKVLPARRDGGDEMPCSSCLVRIDNGAARLDTRHLMLNLH